MVLTEDIVFAVRDLLNNDKGNLNFSPASRYAVQKLLDYAREEHIARKNALIALQKNFAMILLKARTTMAEYIKREELISWLKRIPLKDLSDGRGLCRIIMEEDFKHAIRAIPAGTIVDVAPVVHGRWLEVGYVCGEGEFECSACHKTEWRATISRFNWCPFCGARMDGDSDAKTD